MYSTIAITLLLAATLTSAQPIDDGSQAPYPSAVPQASPYPPAVPQGSQYWEQQPARYPQGFTVQSGYEGIIAPTGPEHEGPSALQKLGGVALGAGILHHFLPFPLNKIVLALGSKLGFFLISVVLLVLVGGAATTAVCALTPICTISFLGLRFNKENVRSFFSQDRLDTITEFVHNAFEKYQKLQDRKGKAFVNKPENKGKKLKYAKVNKEEVKENEKKEARQAKEVETPTTEISNEDKTEKLYLDVTKVEVSQEGRELNEKEVKDEKSNEVPNLPTIIKEAIKQE